MANQTSLVGIVMSVYNGASVVGTAMNSIIAQSVADWMLIVIDDGSDDETRQILSSYARKDSRVRVILHERRLGLAASLNEGIAVCEAPYVARMDADDECTPDRLARQVEFLTSRSDVDVLGTAVHLHNGHGVIRTYYPPTDHETLVHQIWTHNPFVHPSVMFRREWFCKQEGYDLRLRRGQDYDLWLRSYRTSVFANLATPLLKYRFSEQANLRNVYYSSKVLWSAALREGRWPIGLWYVQRPLIAYLAAKTRVLLRYISSQA